MKSAIAYALAFAAILIFAALRARGGSHLAAAPAALESGASAAAAAKAPVPTPAAPDGTGWVGILIAKQAVDVSPRVASLVRAVSVRPGDVVKAGATVATLEARDKAQAVRVASSARRNQASRAARIARLRDATLVTADEAELAKSEEEQRTIELDLARVLVDDATIRAPFDGVIVARFVEPGTHVAAGTPMLRMIDPRGARLRFGVPLGVADTMAPGQTVRFTWLASDRSESARITSVSPEVDRSAGLVVIEADVGSIATFRSGIQVAVHPEHVEQIP